MQWRDYDSDRDRAAAHRIWQEAGWLDDQPSESMDSLVEAGRALLAEMEGEAECLVTSTLGHLRYLNEDLRFSACTSVVTSRIARKQGFARRLLAQLLAADVADGAILAGLGMFDQGFYDACGFGTGSYEHWCAFDPASLKVDLVPRPARRLTREDSDRMHACRLARLRGHGALNLDSPMVTKGEWPAPNKGFALGYCDGPNGEITHLVCGGIDGASNGPYGVRWMAYQTREQFLELMALIKSLGDQVHLVGMVEPPGVQLQDLLDRPFKRHRVTERSKYESGISSSAWWQARICDLPGCLARTHLPCEELRFNLRLSDPVERFLDEGARWRGVAGDYVVTLGPSSAAEPGSDSSLPTLSASVNAFTRLWLGVRPATGLAFTDAVCGPRELLEALDSALSLPQPKPDWGF